MSNTAESIQTLAEETLKEREDLFIVDVRVVGNSGNQKVIVLVDGDQGISIEDCSDISRALSELLDQKNILDQKYTLEVSSPGLDFPLKFIRQYIKNIGRRVKVKLKEGKIIKGELMNASEKEIIIKEDKKSNKVNSDEGKTIPFNEVERTNVLVTF